LGYVCPPAVRDHGGYEAGVTLVAPEAAAVARREALAALADATGN
jgi:hypothetical protein